MNSSVIASIEVGSLAVFSAMAHEMKTKDKSATIKFTNFMDISLKRGDVPFHIQ